MSKNPEMDRLVSEATGDFKKESGSFQVEKQTLISKTGVWKPLDILQSVSDYSKELNKDLTIGLEETLESPTLWTISWTPAIPLETPEAHEA